MQVRRILEATGGDPQGFQAGSGDLGGKTDAELEHEALRLVDRIQADRRRLRAVRDELEVRRVDRVLGLTG